MQPFAPAKKAATNGRYTTDVMPGWTTSHRTSRYDLKHNSAATQSARKFLEVATFIKQRVVNGDTVPIVGLGAVANRHLLRCRNKEKQTSRRRTHHMSPERVLGPTSLSEEVRDQDASL